MNASYEMALTVYSSALEMLFNGRRLLQRGYGTTQYMNGAV